MPRRRLVIYLAIYTVTVVVSPFGYMVIEGWTFPDSIYHTIINVVAFGGVGEVHPLSQAGRWWTLVAKLSSVVCIGGAAYSAIQASLFQRVEIMTNERMRQARKSPINLFISYRRSDSAGYAGRLFDRLSSFFGPEHVFMDIDTIAPGEDFKRLIEASIQACDVLVVVIGPQWTGPGGNRSRIYSEDDFVRLEVKGAIEARLPIFPVLVQGAQMPCIADVPAELGAMLRIQAVELSDIRWNQDVQHLIDAIDTLRQRASLKGGSGPRRDVGLTSAPLRLASSEIDPTVKN